jgi:hypothetical protein
MTAPKLVRRTEVIPKGTSSTVGASVVTVEAVVAEDGSTQSVCLLSGDPVWGQAVASAVQKWKYEPATLEGKPVPTRIAVKMTRTRDMFFNNNGVGLCNTPDQVRPCSDPVRPGDLGRPRGSYPGEAQP